MDVLFNNTNMFSSITEGTEIRQRREILPYLSRILRTIDRNIHRELEDLSLEFIRRYLPNEQREYFFDCLEDLLYKEEEKDNEDKKDIEDPNEDLDGERNEDLNEEDKKDIM